MNAVSKVSRREFMKICPGAGAALVLGFYLAPSSGVAETVAESSQSFAPNAFLRIDGTGAITVWVNKSEMGQGVRTALPMLVAEELEADWSSIRVEQAWLHPRFGNLDTGGSESVVTSWEPLRRAGATAREMLLTAAAQTWGVDKASCHARNGEVIHEPSGKRLKYGKLAVTATRLPIPQEVPLKNPKDFHILGTPLPRTDAPAKVDGSGLFGLDVKVPGMLYAVVARCPVFGGRVVSFDAKRALAIPGVRQVMEISRGVAVVAENTWAAIQGRRALDVQWEEGPNAAESSADMSARFAELAHKPGKVVRNDGDATSALGTASRKIEAVYELPFLAHATMEPMNCTADLKKDRCEIWAPTQFPGWARREVMRLFKLPFDSIRINVTLVGGGFGRRVNPDFVVEAVEVSHAADAPVKVVWTREDDIQHDFYRPASYQRLTAGLDENGVPVSWHHHIVSTSIRAYYQPNHPAPEQQEIQGAVSFPYAVPNARVEYTPAISSVPRGWWRSVADSHTAFAVESFVDELATEAGKDPYELRKSLLRDHRRVATPSPEEVLDTERLKGVLQLAADRAGWGKPLARGQGRGIAAHFSFRSYVAQVAEVSVRPDGSVQVHRVVCAIDCGRVVNPNIVAAQMEGGIVFGLTAALNGNITIQGGRVQQSNFDDYPLLRIYEMPVVEVYPVPSQEPPGGIGEVAVPVIAPAVANAVFAATGTRIRRLPILSQLHRA